jgi:hypothetical protein
VQVLLAEFHILRVRLKERLNNLTEASQTRLVKARSLPYSGAPERDFARLERFAGDKHSSLLRKVVT